VEQGLARVHVWTLAEPPVRLASRPRAYTLQVGAFADERNAVTLKARLDTLTAGTYISTVTAGGQTLYRVRVGSYGSREAATRAAMQVAAHGLTVILMEPD
jgi:cell division protein FtsN